MLFCGLALLYLAGVGGAQPGNEGQRNDEPLPQGALRRLGTTQFRTGARVLSLAYSPDNRWLVSGGGNGPVLLWDATRGRHKAPLADSWVYAIAFSPNTKLLATGGGFKIIRLWDVDTGKEIAQLPQPGLQGQLPHAGTVRALAFSPDGRWLVSASDDHTIKVWDVAARRERRAFKGHADEVTCLAFLGDGKTFASGSGDRTVRIWNVEDGTSKGSLPTEGAVTCLAVHGKTLACGGDDNIVRVWDLEGNKLRHTLPGHRGTVAFVGFIDDGKTLISCGADAEVRRWDVTAGNPNGSFKFREGDGDAFALSNDGKTLACGGLNGVVREFDAASGKPIVPTPGHQSGVTGTVVSPDGKRIASAGSDGIRVWQVDNGTMFRHFDAPNSKHLAEVFLLFSHDGNKLITADGRGDINVWDLAAGNKKALASPAGSSVFTVALSPDGKTLAVGYEKHGLRLISLGEGGQEMDLKYPGFVSNVALSADGKRLAATGKGKIVVFDLPGGQEKMQLGPVGATSCVAFSPNIPLLFAGGYDGMIHIWDLKNGKETRQIEGSGGAILALAVSADGQTLLTGGMDKVVRLWEVASGQEILQWKGHAGTVPCVGFGPKGRVAVSGSADTSVLVWDATGRSKDGALPAVNLEPGELNNLWNDLASADMRKMHAAFWLLVSSPTQAVPLFHKNVFLTNPKHVAKLIADLDSIKFAVREKATIELEKMGRWIEDPLKKALEGTPNIEVRRRVELILERITKEGGLSMDQEYWRIGRALGVLEQDGSPEARKMMQRIAEGAAAAHLRDMAQVALRRLDGGRKE
jgi:WD40 repeat protein